MLEKNTAYLSQNQFWKEQSHENTGVLCTNSKRATDIATVFINSIISGYIGAW